MEETGTPAPSTPTVFNLSLIDTYSRQIAMAIILLAGLFVWFNFPDISKYHTGADEGAYYRMGKTLADDGLSGFHKIADTYVNTPALQDYPNPFRIGTIVTAAVFLKFNDSYHALSAISLYSFLLLLSGTFLFIRRYWSGSLAVFTIFLMAVSPIELAMARRGLMDSLACTSAAFSFFAFFMVVEKGSLRNKTAFIALSVFAILVKETAALLLPFYGLALLYLNLKKKDVVGFIKDVTFLLLPIVLLTGLIYLLAYGWDNVVAIATVIFNIIKGGNQYDQMFDRGPWYRYLIDFLLLSPFTLILAIGFAGYLTLSKNKDGRAVFILWLAVYLLFTYGFLAKNIRYLIIGDLPIKFFAAYAFWTLINTSTNFKLGHALLFMFSIACFDFVSFTDYFITNDIYDTISFNLLTARKIISPYSYSPLANTTTIQGGQSAAIINLKQAALNQPSATNYVNLSLEYYKSGLYMECIWANQEALRLQPSNLLAYNNICASYNALKDWPDAIKAAKQALAIDSTFQLAKNNLNWAMSQAALQNK